MRSMVSGTHLQCQHFGVNTTLTGAWGEESLPPYYQAFPLEIHCRLDARTKKFLNSPPSCGYYYLYLCTSSAYM